MDDDRNCPVCDQPVALGSRRLNADPQTCSGCGVDLDICRWNGSTDSGFYTTIRLGPKAKERLLAERDAKSPPNVKGRLEAARSALLLAKADALLIEYDIEDVAKRIAAVVAEVQSILDHRL